MFALGDTMYGAALPIFCNCSSVIFWSHVRNHQRRSWRIGRDAFVFAAQRTILTVTAERSWNPQPRDIIAGQI